MIIAVDFDGTLAVTEYPHIICPINEVLSFVRRYKEYGNTIILNTCRHGKELDEAVEWCKNHGLVFDYVNENVPELIEKYGDSRKIYADVYIDDRAISTIDIITEL